MKDTHVFIENNKTVLTVTTLKFDVLRTKRYFMFNANTSRIVGELHPMSYALEPRQSDSEFFYEDEMEPNFIQTFSSFQGFNSDLTEIHVKFTFVLPLEYTHIGKISPGKVSLYPLENLAFLDTSDTLTAFKDELSLREKFHYIRDFETYVFLDMDRVADSILLIEQQNNVFVSNFEALPYFNGLEFKPEQRPQDRISKTGMVTFKCPSKIHYIPRSITENLNKEELFSLYSYYVPGFVQKLNNGK